MKTEHLLLPQDLIPDRSLQDGDSDAFNHEAIAGRVAEIVLTAPTPTNIALFGAWGSGKSSMFELLRRVLKSRGDHPVALVRYDAWKYGGASLKKNFISHAATELGFGDDHASNRQYHRGLYESTRSLDLRFSQFLKGEAGAVVRAAVMTTAIALVLVVAFAVIVAGITQRGILATISLWAGTWGAPVAGGLGTLVAVLKLLDIAKVEIEQTAPSADEQFSKTFSRLVERARERDAGRKFERLLFFIDELDRCSKRDVVETLSALRTFLDVPHCVFIVVADRDVLEEALLQLPQSTPASEASPYYSTASAFLDKIFQFQIALPPLRVGKLTRYARDLVVGRDGLWKELRDDDDERLNEVVYALIPSHVRSPRRVKVLLNRFATNARIAQARGLAWIRRAPEIAKMTVLETEFPLFADALITEPRLPEYVLAREGPDPLPERSASVINRFVSAAQAATRGGDFDDEADGVLDRVIATSSEVDAIHRAQQRQLIRYLERTARFANPGRDLLYLEAAGAWTGLDPAAGQILEDLAPDSPSRALDAVESMAHQERQVALGFVCGIIDREFGVERQNALDVGLGIAQRLEENLDEALYPLAKALQAFLREQELAEHQLGSALRVALASQDSELVSALMEDERLLTDSDRVADLAAHLPLIPDDDRAQIAEQVGTFFASDPGVLLSPLDTLDSQDAEWLIEQTKDAVVQHVNALDESGDLEPSVEVLKSMLERTKAKGAARGVIWKLLAGHESKAAHKAVIGSLDYFRTVPKRPRNSFALLAIQNGPVSDWPLLGPLLSGKDSGWETQGKRAKKVVDRLIAEFPTLGEDVAVPTLELATKAAIIADSAGTDVATDIAATLSAALQARRWWTNEALLSHQRALHLLGSHLQAGGPSLEDAISETRTQDLIRSLANPSQVSQHGLLGVSELSHDLSSSSLKLLVEKIGDIKDATPASLTADVALCRIELWGRLSPSDRSTVGSVPSTDVVTAMGDFADARLPVLKNWLETGPTTDEALQVAEHVPPRALRAVARLYQSWATNLNEEQRTAFLHSLWERGQTAAMWIRQFQPLGLNEMALTGLLVDSILAAPRAQQREERIDRLLALSPNDGRAQYRVGDLVVALLSTGLKVDVDLALRAVPALGSGHRSKGRIEDALRSATADLEVKITRSQAESLKAVGIRPPKRTFTERAWDFLSGN